MNPASELGNAHGKITIDVSGVQSAINQAQGTLASGLGGLGSNIQGIGQNLTQMGSQMSIAFAPITGFVTNGIFAFSRFQDVLAEIQARTGLTNEEMQTVRETALQMGADTSFSATQAAEAFLQLASSGQSVEQAMGTLPYVLDLAAAGGIDLGYAADGLTDILAQFQLPVQAINDSVWEMADKFGTSRAEFEAWDGEVGKITPGMEQLANAMHMSVREVADLIAFSEDAASVTNTLAAAAGASSATVDQMIQAFANAGPVANMFGLSVEETAAAIAVFAENGIKGSEAGTQLKSMLNNMARNTDDVQTMWHDLGISMYDATGNMRPLNDIIQDLNVAMADMTDAERIETINTLAGSYGQVGLNALLSANGIESMEHSMSRQTSATVVAAARMNTFSGRIESLKGSIETLSINLLGPLVENYLTPLAEKVIEVVNTLSEWVVQNEDLAAGIALVLGVLAIIGPIIMGVGLYVTALGSAIAAVGAVIGFMLSPIGLLLLAVVGIGAAILYLTDTSLGDLVNMLGRAVHWITEFTQGLIQAFQGGGIEGAGDFITNNLILPLMNALASIDWTQVLSDMWARFKTALGTASALLWDALTWLNDNVLAPIATAALNADWNAIVTDITNALIAALGFLAVAAWDAAGWLWAHVLTPIILAVINADWNAIGSAVWLALQAAFAASLAAWDGVNQWILDHIVTPIKNAIGKADLGQIAKDVATGLWNALTTQVAGIIDMNKWILDQIIKPVKEALGIASPSTIFFDIGKNIVEGLASGIIGMIGTATAAAQALFSAVSGPLNDIITLAAQALTSVGGAVNSAIGSPITPNPNVNLGQNGPYYPNTPHRARGGGVLGGASYLVGERGPEPFTPNSNGGIMPNDVWEALKNIAASLSGPALATAMSQAGGGSRGGDTYNLSVAVPVEVLRDEPNLAQNANTFADTMLKRLQEKGLSS